MTRAIVLLAGWSAVASMSAAQDPPRDRPPAHVIAARQEAALKAEIAAEGLTEARAVALAGFQVTRGALDEAEKTLQHARTRFPENADVVRGLADVLTRQAEIEKDPERRLRKVAEAARLRAQVAPPSEAAPCQPAAEVLGGQAPVRVGGNIKAPIKTKDVRPVYPDAARAERVMGVVILEIALDGAGKVAQACVLRSIPLLDAAAVEAVKQWEFTPTLLNGAPVPVIMTVTVNFTLQ